MFLRRSHKGAKVVKDIICWLPESWLNKNRFGFAARIAIERLGHYYLYGFVGQGIV
jgi:hypothetical protein